ncbi:PilW family protein [Thiohalomonas denitrificans]|uniref:Prepilin peptidase dependent protein B n=1 Tax=Thiohalomonas denitrificans TaxID=415747 RepID=A0A1G5PR07_9GAMM|nr:prepilin-type N-terminal cleavage/methylation domain-containing protein [Thiohalomonas denitrificans]SCZ51600.1 prepilin peptidase dependent protein B [Thiohalomonas denitrificans]
MLAMNPRLRSLPDAGFSLVELMIAVTLGILVIGGVLSVFASTVRSNSDMLKITKIEEELAAAMTYMVRDIRRAGHMPAVYDPANVGTGFANIFDAIIIADTDGDSPADDFDCLLYSYDEDGDGNLDDGTETPTEDHPDERRGFRFDTTSQAIEERQSGADCVTGGWENITASNIAITNLQFDLVPASVSLSTGQSINVRRLTITINGQLANDPEVARTLQQTIRIRNDSITTP